MYQLLTVDIVTLSIIHDISGKGVPFASHLKMTVASLLTLVILIGGLVIIGRAEISLN